MSRVIHGRYVPQYWNANPAFAYKKTHFDWKFDLFDQLFKCK